MKSNEMNFRGKLSKDDAPEFVGQIIDIFEDFLEERNVCLDNDKREYNPNAAIIYGSDFGELQSSIYDTLIHWGLLSPLCHDES